MTRKLLWLTLAVIALALVPLCLPRPRTADSFSGADAQAGAMIARINPHYTPWAVPLFTPPSGEVETFLFALQAAVGAGALCFYLGYRYGRRETRVSQEDPRRARA